MQSPLVMLTCASTYADVNYFSQATAANAVQSGADGVVVSIGSEVKRHSSSAASAAGVTAAIKALRAALPQGALVSMMVQLPVGPSHWLELDTLATVCDYSHSNCTSNNFHNKK